MMFEEPEKVSVAILGSTGSIGKQTLEVIEANPDRFDVVALVAGSDAKLLGAQAERFKVPLVGLVQGSITAPTGAAVITGEDAASEVVEACGAQIVVNAVMGAAGLKATMATILSGRTLALANKESLVAAGELVMAKAGPGQIRPVDSEHSAIWQLLEGTHVDQVRRIFITGSGGPFRGKTLDELKEVTVEQALAHPTWQMGRKITIDSATLMNKGLEVIEAHFLFGFTYDEIEVVIHPQSVVHAMVETFDGATLMHAAPPDMRLPIGVALSWPDRLTAGIPALDWRAQQLTFEPVDRSTFKALDMAYEAGRAGDTYPAVLNAANEVAVEGFLNGAVGYLGIIDVVEQVIQEHDPQPADLGSVLEQDAWARGAALSIIEANR